MSPVYRHKGVPFAQFAALAGIALERGQAVLAAVAFDGAQPSALGGDQRELARAIFGDVDTVPEQARSVVVQVKGRDVGGSRLGALRAVHLAATHPLDRYDSSEAVYCFFIGPKLRLARIPKRFALSAARRLGLTIEGEHADGFTIVRHDGRRVIFECVAASRGGDTARGVPVLFAMLDEAAFFRDESTGVVNDRHVFNAIVPRLIGGGQILIVSSPWAEAGLLYEEFQRNHGRPTTALAAHCPTMLMRDDPDVRANVERELARDPENGAREFGAEFLPAGTSQFFDAGAITNAVDESLPSETPPFRVDVEHVVGVGYDPAYIRDAGACIALLRRLAQDPPAPYIVAHVQEWRPAKGRPLVPSTVDGAACEIAVRYGSSYLTTDVHCAEHVRERAEAAELELALVPGGAGGKGAIYGAFRDALHAGLVKIPASQKRLIQQLREVVSVPLPGGGTKITSPRRAGGHGDLVSALCAAFWRADFAARNAEADWSLIVAGGRDNPGVRIYGSRTRLEPPRGATGVVRSANGISYNDPSGVRVTRIA